MLNLPTYNRQTTKQMSSSVYTTYVVCITSYLPTYPTVCSEQQATLSKLRFLLPPPPCSPSVPCSRPRPPPYNPQILAPVSSSPPPPLWRTYGGSSSSKSWRRTPCGNRSEQNLVKAWIKDTHTHTLTDRELNLNRTSCFIMAEF